MKDLVNGSVEWWSTCIAVEKPLSYHLVWAHEFQADEWLIAFCSNSQSNEIINLKKQVAELMKASELNQMERAESINRLTRSLHESQLHCNQLLEAG